MCGRFFMTLKAEDLEAAFPDFKPPAEWHPRYNIAPTQPVPVVINDGQQRITFLQWGLVPAWAKDPAIGNRLINARAETLAEKPSFRAAYRRRRCLILADGFYEWRAEPGQRGKTPLAIRLRSGATTSRRRSRCPWSSTMDSSASPFCSGDWSPRGPRIPP